MYKNFYNLVLPHSATTTSKLNFYYTYYILMMGLASKKMMALQSIYFGDKILFTLNNKRIR